MQIKQNFHCEETKKDIVLVRILDVNLFPSQTTLSWETKEPTELIINELFNHRFNLMGGSNKEFLKLNTFRVLSKVKIGADKFCVSWVANVQYLQKYFLTELNLAIKENQFLLFHGRFTFWRVGTEWKAKIC